MFFLRLLFVLLFSGVGGFAFAAPFPLAPHRAVYAVSLEKNRAGSGLSDVEGSMTFALQDLCGGWATEQNTHLHFVYVEGDDTHVSSPVATWESKDGRAFRFQAGRVLDGQESEAFKGRVLREDSGTGVARYTLPPGKQDIPVTEAMLFPAAFMAVILEKAHKGEKLFSRTVFDGADAAGFVDVSVFIGTETAPPEDAAALDGAARALLTPSVWPVRQAFFSQEDPDGEPDYEMEILLQPNGVARALSIDYGLFTLRARLIGLEPVPMAASCFSAVGEGAP